LKTHVYTLKKSSVNEKETQGVGREIFLNRGEKHPSNISKKLKQEFELLLSLH
jgi:hypothetical protein